jgi:hypothetical protein
MRWTRWGARHLAAIGAYEANTSVSPQFVILVGSDGSPGFWFGQGGVGTYNGSWGLTSDYRAKSNVVEIDGDLALEAVRRSRPVEFDRVEEVHAGKRFPGFIAHEIQQELPLIVRGEKDAMKPDMEDPEKLVPDLQSVDYIAMVPYLTAALAKVDALLSKAMARIESLEAQLGGAAA